MAMSAAGRFAGPSCIQAGTDERPPWRGPACPLPTGASMATVAIASASGVNAAGDATGPAAPEVSATVSTKAEAMGSMGGSP
jgi:hypothetical protein